VHVPKDERSKLDSKTKQCILLGHPDDGFGYRLWNPINKKIVRSRDVVFFEDLTIEDIVKPKKQITAPRVVDLDPAPTLVVHNNDGGDDSTQDASPEASSDQGGDQPPEHSDGDVDEDVEIDDPPVEGQQQEQLRRTSRVPRLSSRYSPHEYLLLTDGGEPSCYEEALSDQHKDQWLDAMQDEMNSLYENNTFEL